MTFEWVKKKSIYSTTRFSILLFISALFVAPITYRWINLIERYGGIIPIDITIIGLMLISINLVALLRFSVGRYLWAVVLMSLGFSLTTTHETHLYQASLGVVWIISSIYIFLIKSK